MYRVHNLVKFIVNFFSSPVNFHSVLGHFESRSSHPPRIHRFTRSVSNFIVYQHFDCFRCTSHIRNFGNYLHSVFDKNFGIFRSQFILGSARHRDINRDRPRFFAFKEFGSKFLSVRFNYIIISSSKFEHIVNFLRIKSIFVIDISIRSRYSNDFPTKFDSFFSSSPGNVSETRDRDSFINNIKSFKFKHICKEIHSTISSSFGSNERPTVCHTFTRKHASIFLCKFSIHTIQESDFSPPHADITSRDISLRSYIFPQFPHKCLTESHYFGIGFTFRRKIRSSFSAPHR